MVKGTGYAMRSYADLKQGLISSNALISLMEGRCTVGKLYSFSGFSAAATVVPDRDNNRQAEWNVKAPRQSSRNWHQRRIEREGITK